MFLTKVLLHNNFQIYSACTCIGSFLVHYAHDCSCVMSPLTANLVMWGKRLWNKVCMCLKHVHVHVVHVKCTLTAFNSVQYIDFVWHWHVWFKYMYMYMYMYFKSTLYIYMYMYNVCCLVCRTSQVRIPPEAALLFLLGKKELSLGVVALLCLVSMTDCSCTCIHVHVLYIHNIYMYMYDIVHVHVRSIMLQVWHV